MRTFLLIVVLLFCFGCGGHVEVEHSVTTTDDETVVELPIVIEQPETILSSIEPDEDEDEDDE